MSGISTLSLFKYTRSPNTDLDAQFFVERGLLKNTGLKNIHSKETIPGIRHHQLIQTRLQNVITINGRTEYLVHTLHGFECFIQFSSVNRNAFAIFLSIVIRYLVVHNAAHQQRRFWAAAGWLVMRYSANDWQDRDRMSRLGGACYLCSRAQ